MTRALALAVAALVAGAPPGLGLSTPSARTSTSSSPAARCPPGVPGYECFSRRELWEGAERWRSKHHAAELALATCTSRKEARTSTVVEALVVPAERAACEEDDVDDSLAVLAAVGAAGVVLGLVVGILIAPKQAPMVAH